MQRALSGAAALLAIASCTDSSNVSLVEVSAVGGIVGQVYLDANGNGRPDEEDRPIPRLDVVLMANRGGAAVATAQADSGGVFRMTDIPVGSYRLGLDESSAGDSLSVSGNVQVVVVKDLTKQADLGVTYPVLSLEEIRTGSVGRKVFTSGIALNPRPNFGDGVVHIQADTLYLRATNVARAAIATGDSLRILGRIKVDQKVLDEVTPFVLVNIAAIPIPLERGTGQSADAEGGKIDAALVRVRDAEIADTSTLNGDFHFFLDDGTGPIEVVLRSFLQLNPSPIRPDTIVRARAVAGLLVPVAEPTGGVRWRLLPRAGGDVILETKEADLALGGFFANDSTVQKGDTVTFTVVVTNLGPLAASGVQVVDSVPEGLTYLDATTTRGVYSQTTAIWSLDSLAVTATDTLRLRAEVTTDLVGTTPARVRILPPAKEVDPNLSNNVASFNITIQPPGSSSPGR